MHKKLIHFSFFVFLFLSCKEENKSNPSNLVSPSSPIKSNVVNIGIQWEYTNLPLRMQIHELSGNIPMELWTTGSSSLDKKKPYGLEIEDGKFALSPGSKKSFMLVMENHTDKDVYFFASPHSALPVEHSFGFKFKCLCVNHAFTVPVGHVWYRVVEIRLAPNFLGDSLSLTHNLIGITKDRVSEFQKSSKESIHSEHD